LILLRGDSHPELCAQRADESGGFPYRSLVEATAGAAAGFLWKGKEQTLYAPDLVGFLGVTELHELVFLFVVLFRLNYQRTG